MILQTRNEKEMRKFNEKSKNKNEKKMKLKYKNSQKKKRKLFEKKNKRKEKNNIKINRKIPKDLKNKKGWLVMDIQDYDLNRKLITILKCIFSKNGYLKHRDFKNLH